MLKKSYSFKPNKKEHPYIIKWLSVQTNFNDAVRFLIEEDIKKNGIRDLSETIPSIRSFDNIELSNDQNESKEKKLEENKNQSKEEKLEENKNQSKEEKLEENKENQIPTCYL